MILDFFGSNIDGDLWEDICQKCYCMKYQDDHYMEIPAAYRGDAGIEGFTQNGIVNQCYYPEKTYSDDELYEHLRDKMTKDTEKLINEKYKQRLKKLGVPKIKEWHFVIPEYKDSRIIEHAAKRTDVVLKKKEQDPQKYDYIDDSFRIIVKQAKNFLPQLAFLIRGNVSDLKLNMSVRNVKDPDWSKCDSIKVENIKRKVLAVMGTPVDEEHFKDVIKTYVICYLKGLELLQKLQNTFPEIYEDLLGLISTYKKEVFLKTSMNTDKSLNAGVFNGILSEFEGKLKDTFKESFTPESISELKLDIVSMWLADCSMYFV